MRLTGAGHATSKRRWQRRVGQLRHDGLAELVERAKMILGLSNATNKVALLTTDQRGVAAVEFALFAGVLSISILNVADISIYVYQRMEVENATEMGAQAALKTVT